MNKTFLSLTLVAAMLILGVVGYFAWPALAGSGDGAAVMSTRLATAEVGDMDVTLTKRGELHAIENIEIINRVERRTSLTYLIPEGTRVKEGDLLVTVDASQTATELEETQMEVAADEAELVNAREQLEIQKSKNAAELEGAKVMLQLAELELAEYTNGKFPQLKRDAETEVQMAELNLKNKEDDFRQTRALQRKGFVTQAETKKKEEELIQARNRLVKARGDLQLLLEYTHPKDITSLNNKLMQATGDLERVARQNSAEIARLEAQVRSRELRLMNRRQRLAHWEQQYAATRITAPAPGIVVYNNDGRNDSEQIIEGAEVRHRQTLLKLPNTEQMKVVVRINESDVTQLDVGMKSTVRLPGGGPTLSATITRIAPLADSGNRWFNPDLREFPVDLVLDETPGNVKPGNSVETTIFIERLSDVLKVPLTSIFRVGQASFVFVPEGERLTPRQVQIGAINQTDAQVTDGLEAGDRVLVLQVGEGARLLEQAGINLEQFRTPPQRPGRGGPPQGAPQQANAE
ncbi:MAG: HlyD family efflux transporter periplasmic adaptor subunit [Phycisphaerae bacterium]